MTNYKGRYNIELMDNELVKLLQKTGFSQKEAMVYLALLELGQADISDIAKKAGLKRAIVYVLIENLLEKGCATQLPNRKINTYQAIDPGVILTQTKNTAQNLAEMVPYLRSLHDKSRKRPKIHFIDTKEGILKIYDDINNYDNQFFISSYSKIEEHFPGAMKMWIDGYKKTRHKYKGRHLIPEKDKNFPVVKDFLAIGQKIKVITGVEEIKMDFAIYGNKIAITSFENKPYIVAIESQDLVDSLMPIMEIAWKAGRAV